MNPKAPQPPKVRLVTPNQSMCEAYHRMIKDWKSDWDEVTPWLLRDDASDFAKLVRTWDGYSKGIGLDENWVPNSTFFLLDADQEIVGVINIRHYLNDRFRNGGGHMGYGVPPSQRGKGYATLMLELALVEARQMGIDDVLLSIFPDNSGSRKVILNNGGQASGKGFYRGREIEFYWIRKQ